MNGSPHVRKTGLIIAAALSCMSVSGCATFNRDNRLLLNALDEKFQPRETWERVASIGLRIRKGWSYHGMAVNVSLDVTPFLRINPCGYAGLEICRLADLGGPAEPRAAAEQLLPLLLHRLGYNTDGDTVPEIEDES